MSTHTAWPFAAVTLATTLGVAGFWAGAGAHPTAPATPTAAPTAAVPLAAPDPDGIPAGELGDAIRRGRYLAEHTSDALPGFVGADLACTSCHLDGATRPGAGPWVGLTGAFPEYRARAGTVVTLERRIDDCFERSLNGRPLPMDGPDMASLVAYVTWLSKDVPVGAAVEGRGFPPLATRPVPDRAHGAEVFATRCAVCHGDDGQGRADVDGVVVPPLWGDRSFNVGAGMARLDTAAAFVKTNMPYLEGGSLTDQEAYDVAAFFTTQPRPDFPGKVADWPKGDKPRDARY